ncbi:unnamed protein product, partial [Brassica oleracea]
KQQTRSPPPTEAVRQRPVPQRSTQHLFQTGPSSFHTACSPEHQGAPVHQGVLFWKVI